MNARRRGRRILGNWVTVSNLFGKFVEYGDLVDFVIFLVASLKDKNGKRNHHVSPFSSDKIVKKKHLCSFIIKFFHFSFRFWYSSPL